MPGRILVTGGSGFIGHHLVKALSKNPENVVTIIDDLSNSNPNFRIEEFKNIAFYKEDIRNREAVRTIVHNENIDTCVHLAAKISVPDSIVDPFTTVDVNVNGMLSVLDACARNNVKQFVFASSAAVYGESRVVPTNESQELTPLSPYGASKVAGEALLDSFRNSGMIRNGVSLRFFNVYGVGQSPEYAGVITKFAERLSSGRPPIIYGTGHQTRDFISVDDIIQAIVLAADSELSGVFNVGTGTSTSVNDLARLMRNIYRVEMQPIHHEAQKGDIVHSCADISRAKQLLNFLPQGELSYKLGLILNPSRKKQSVVAD